MKPKKLDTEKYLRIVKRVAREVHAIYPAQIDMDELIQVGWIGAMKGYWGYRKSKKASLETYMRLKIRGEMVNEIHKIPDVKFVGLEKVGIE